MLPLAIDRRRLGLLRPTKGCVSDDAVRGDILGARPGEIFPKMAERASTAISIVAGYASEAFPPVSLVVIDQDPCEIFKASSFDRRADRPVLNCRSNPLLEKLVGLGFVCRTGRFAVQLPCGVVVNPPDRRLFFLTGSPIRVSRAVDPAHSARSTSNLKGQL